MKRFSAACRLARVSLMVAVGFSLSGCGSLYLHHEPTQEVTAKAKEEFDKVSLASVFDAEASYLEELERQQSAAVAVEMGLQRDGYMLNALQGRRPPDGGERRDGRSELIEMIDGWLTALVGATDRVSAKPKWSAFIGSARDSTQDTEQLAALRKRLLTQRENIQAANPSAFSLDLPTEFTLDEALENLAKHLADVDEKKRAHAAEKKALQDELASATQALEAKNASQQQFTDLVTKINALLAQAQAESNPYLAVLVSEVGLSAAGALQERLDDLIKVTDPKDLSGATDSTSRATLGFVSAALGVNDAFSDPPRVPHPNTLAATKAWFAYLVAQWQGRVQEAQAKEALLRRQVDAVGEQVYYLSRASTALKSITSKPALKDHEGLASLLQDKDAETRTAAHEALYYFSCAWNRGFIPSEQLQRVTVNIADRQAKLQRSRESADAWLGTLKPAVATLAAYGEGGIDPHILAELLKTLGIGAIAVGVN